MRGRNGISRAGDGSRSLRRRASRLPALLIAASCGAVAVPAAGKSLRFEQAFATAGEPAAIRYRVLYRSGDAVHHLEVERQGDRRIRRSTDRRLVSYASHTPGDPYYDLTLLDTAKRISTRVDRTNLYRLGNFADWFDLGHGLRHPRAGYVLTAGKAPAAMPRVPGSCGWYDLAQQGRTTHICWDRTDRLPLLIVSSEGQLMWRVTAVDLHPIPASDFDVADQGYVRNDADEDIEGD